jgi:hypothetical protein
MAERFSQLALTRGSLERLLEGVGHAPVNQVGLYRARDVEARARLAAPRQPRRIIRAAMKHVWWSVICATPECGIPLLVTYAGIYDPDHPPVLGDGAAQTFQFLCGVCGKRHTYNRGALRSVIISPVSSPLDL